MPYAVSTHISDRERCRKMQEYLDTCSMETPEEVAQFFTYYTYLIWDYQFFGEIYRMYSEDIVMNHGGGFTVQGMNSVFRDTMESKLGMTFNYKHIFTDIFAEGDPEKGYHFVQSTSYCFPQCYEEGQMPDLSGRDNIVPQGLGNCMCECELRKIRGRWVITEEWMC